MTASRGGPICVATWPVPIGVLLTIFAGLSVNAQSSWETDSPGALSGFEASQVFKIEDGQPVDLNDPLVIQLLYRAGKTSAGNLSRYAGHTESVSIGQIANRPRHYRLWVKHLQGRVKRVSRHRISQSSDDGVMRSYFLIELVTDDGTDALVAARTVPSAWKSNQDMDEPAACHGFFFSLVLASNGQHAKRGERAPTEKVSEEVNRSNEVNAAKPLFVANRLSWFPDTPDERQNVGTAHVLLAQHGVDIGFFDVVRRNNNRPVTREESDVFYQMLVAGTRINSQDMPAKVVGFQDLLSRPGQHFGEAVKIQGRVRRAVPIQVGEGQIKRGCELQQYYELDMFVSLGDQQIVVKTNDDRELSYQHRFPATVCVGQLPGPPESIENRLVEVSGFFFKFWNYESRFTQESQAGQGQVSPLIIGLEPRVVQPAAAPINSLLVGMLFVFAIGAVAMILIYRHSDRNSANALRRRTNQLPDQVDLSNLEQDPKG